MNASILFLIPARGGSRRLPGKNLLPVGGIPLVGRSIRVAQSAAAAIPGGPHRVVCTTDDPAIADVARQWGGEVLERPAELATSDATSVDVALHALEAIDAGDAFETVVLLQPTSPLTDSVDVTAAVARHREGRGVSVASVTRGHPAAWHNAIGQGGSLEPASVSPGTEFLLTGAFYVVAPHDLRRTRQFVQAGKTIGQEVAAERSIDVDEPMDLVAAEALLASRRVREVPLGDLRIGSGRVVVIAEAGVNHDGDVGIAHRLIDAAADAGADVVKFQIFDPDALAAAGAPRAAYQERDGVPGADQRAMLAELSLPGDAWAGLATHGRDRGIGFLATPFDDASATILDDLDVPAFKLGSGELTNLPFIARLARRGRPLLISTGMADMIEVAAAVDTVAASGNPPIALFHCVSSYPAAAQDANLLAIETMRRAFGVPVGWSDHTLGSETALAAVALGASVVEKHLTLDRQRSGPDHRASLEPVAFAEMIAGIHAVEAALGTGVKAPVPAEADVAAVARRSLHWRRSLEKGAVVEAGDLEALRPGTGVPPSRLIDLLGRRTTRPVRAGDAVRSTDVEDHA